MLMGNLFKHKKDVNIDMEYEKEQRQKKKDQKND